MCDPHNLHQTDRDSSTETESTDHIIMPGDASNSMGDVEILKTKKVKVLEEIEIESPDPDLDHVEEEKEMKEKERMKRCKYCGRGFQSDQALGGHLRVHSQHHPNNKSKPVKSRKRGREFEEDDDEGFFGCFICKQSFSSMQFLCQHVRNYHRPKPKGSTPTSSNKLDSPHKYSWTEAAADDQKYQTTTNTQQQQQQEGKIHSAGGCNDLLKHMPNWSETGKRTSAPKNIDLANIIYDAAPLRACYGLLHSDHTEMENQSHSNQSHDLSSRNKISIRHLFGKFNNPNPNPKRSKSNKTSTVHQCEICGKIFETGQALGGHKSYHRSLNSDIESLRQMLIQRKPKQQPAATNIGHLGNIVLFGTEISAASAHQCEESSDQEHPPRTTLLDFDLNIPYQG